MNNGHIYIIQIIFVTGIAIGSQILNFEDKYKWLNVARYVVYILTIHGVPEACKLANQLISRGFDPAGLLKVAEGALNYILIYLSSVALLVTFEQKLFHQDFIFLFLGYLIVNYPKMAQPSKPSINYGVGMACSYFEGYLVHILPSDGATFVGFEENIRVLEDREGVLFPVKKLFIIITKSLYSPPDLKEFNSKFGMDVPHLEAFNCLADVKKSVAGVRDRKYHNTAYKIYRPPSSPAVCLAAECATPLHTLHKVLCNRTLYDELADINVESVVADFCSTLRSILDKSPQCRGKCELIFYDHEDPKQNLSEILLGRIRELVPDFEQKIIARRNENIVEEH